MLSEQDMKDIAYLLVNILHRHLLADRNFFRSFGDTTVAGINTLRFSIAAIGSYVPHGSSSSQFSPPGITSWSTCGTLPFISASSEPTPDDDKNSGVDMADDILQAGEVAGDVDVHPPTGDDDFDILHSGDDLVHPPTGTTTSTSSRPTMTLSTLRFAMSTTTSFRPAMTLFTLR